MTERTADDWATVEDGPNTVHLIPLWERHHAATKRCACKPTLETYDPASGFRIWKHVAKEEMN